MINLGFVMGFIGAAVGIIIGILIFSEISTAIDCPGEGEGKDGADDATVEGYDECMRAETTAWTVIGILPIALFFALFGIFGGLGGRQD